MKNIVDGLEISDYRRSQMRRWRGLLGPREELRGDWLSAYMSSSALMMKVTSHVNLS